MLMTEFTFNPSAVQSDTVQPLSAVENGHAPLDVWRYQSSRSPGQSSRTFHIKKPFIRAVNGPKIEQYRQKGMSTVPANS